MKEFMKRKNIVFSLKRYGVDCLGAMAQGLFCSLLIGTIIKTLRQQTGMEYLVTAGTYAASMAGFAVMSFPENKWGGLISQGLGTSMLQMGNIVKNPRIWIPPIVASVITGPSQPACSSCR